MKHHLDGITGPEPLIETDDCSLTGHIAAGESGLRS